jgi:hypothetical protein
VATARERLLQSLTAIISQAFSAEGKVALRRLLNTYRVQAKPGENVSKSQTARDVLAANIQSAWLQNGALNKQEIEGLISPFRVQIKQGLIRARYDDDRANTSLNNTADTNALENSMSLRGKEINRIKNPYFRDKAKDSESDDKSAAIGGGPLQKAGGRGQCPKCRSKGIVLARSYGMDDYHSCIYCGFQAQLKSHNAQADLPLAAELLSITLDEPDLD